MNKPQKQYGLIAPKKAQLSAPKIGNVFGADDDSDAEEGVDWVKKALRAEGEKNQIKKQTKLNMAKALNEDPTIFQYDEIYDDMEKSKKESKSSEKSEAKKPRYIQNLMKAAERRKREQEHRIERMVQKEREEEGEMYADKESFVTSAYRAKLEEFKKMEEEEARMDRLEAIGDVTKQQDMSGFYRQLFAQTVGGEKLEELKPLANEGGSTEKSNPDEDTASESESGSEPDDSQNKASDDDDKTTKITSKVNKKRQYRKRNCEKSESESESEEEEVNEIEENEDNLDGPVVDQDKIIDGNTSEPSSKKMKLNEDDDNENKGGEDKSKVDQEESDNSKIDDKEKSEKKNQEAKVVEKKISIWEKRTVGPILEAALERYYTRKALRSAS